MVKKVKMSSNGGSMASHISAKSSNKNDQKVIKI